MTTTSVLQPAMPDRLDGSRPSAAAAPGPAPTLLPAQGPLLRPSPSGRAGALTRLALLIVGVGTAAALLVAAIAAVGMLALSGLTR